MVGKIATPGWMYNFSYERVFVNMSFGASTSLSAASVVLLDNIIRICAKKTTSVCRRRCCLVAVSWVRNL